MNVREVVARSLVVAFMLGVFLVAVLQPTAHEGPFVSFGIVFVLEAAAYAVSFALFRGSAGYQAMRLLIVSAALAAFFVYFLKPAATLIEGWEATYVAVVVIEATGLVAGRFIGRKAAP